MITEETDILIIGAGPAGSILSKYLSQANVDNILIQRNLNYRKPCGGGIRVDGFEEFDIDKKLIKKSIDTITIVHKDKRVEIDISCNPIGIVDRVEFDKALRQDAVLCGTKLLEAIFVDVAIFDGYIIATVKYDNEYKKIKANYLVGADGVNSKVRKIVNKDKVSSKPTQYADIANMQTNSCEFHLGSRVAGIDYAWVFPHLAGTNIGVVKSTGNNAIEHLYDDIGREKEEKIFGYNIPYFDNTLFYKDRVFFVGDSASQVLPFTYEGIYYAMSSAKILSSVIIDKAVETEYEKRWNEKHLNHFSTLGRLQKVFLKNDLRIAFMMKMYQNKYIQQELVKLWLGKRRVELNLSFFLRAIKRVFS